MSYEEFDLVEMLNSGTLAKQRVCVLVKYIHKHNLLAVKGKNKLQKVNAIMDHLRSSAYSTPTNKAPSVWKRWMIMMNVKWMKGIRYYPLGLVMTTLYQEK